MQTSKLLRQAGQFIVAGKLSLALEQYLKIHELDPQDTTIINTIGDLNLRLGKEAESLLWFQKLARIFDSRGLAAQATAICKKILKLSPQNQAAMTRLAELYEKEGQTSNAKAQYAQLAGLLVSLGQYDAALLFYQRICRLDPDCPRSWLQLARTFERSDRVDGASRAYLQCAELLVKSPGLATDRSFVEELFRLRIRNKEFAISFFRRVRQANLTDLGVKYLESIGLDKDPEIRAMLVEAFLEDGKLESAQDLIANSTVHPSLYAVGMRLLQALITRKQVDAGLTVAEALVQTSLQQHDEVTLKSMLISLSKCDESNHRAFKLLATILVRMGQGHEIERYSKRFVILQLQRGNVSDARDELKKMIGYSEGCFYLALFNRLDEAILSGANLSKTCDIVRRALETGIPAGPAKSPSERAFGVSEADIGWASRAASASHQQCLARTLSD